MIKSFYCNRGTIQKSNFGAWRDAETWINNNAPIITVKRCTVNNDKNNTGVTLLVDYNYK